MSLADGSYGPDKIQGWLERLKSVYNRGLSDGYYLGKKQGAWSITPHNQARLEKVFVGEVRHYYPKAGVMQLQLIAHPLSVGDEILITGHTTGLCKDTVRELRSEDDRVLERAKHPGLVTLPIQTKVRVGDKVYIFRDRQHKK